MAEVLGGAAFVLDKENGLVRVAVKGGGPGVSRAEEGPDARPTSALTLDFLPLYCQTLEDDLGRRDFTVNAMAMDLGAILEYALRLREASGASGGTEGALQGECGQAGKEGGGGRGPARGAPLPVLIDPSGGVRDCELGVIRIVSQRALAEDPLRCLRAVRLSMEYGLVIEPQTSEEIRKGAHLITERGVAAERIRDELAIIFTRPGTAAALCELASLGLIKAVMPAVFGLLSSSTRPSEREAARGAELPPLPTLAALDDVDEMIEEMALRGPSPWADEMKAELRAVGPPSPLLTLKLAAFFLDLASALEEDREEGEKEEGEAARGLAVEVLTALAFGKKTTRAVRGLISLLGLYEGAPARAMASSLFKPLFLDLIRRETGLAPPLFFVLSMAHERATSKSPSEGAAGPRKTTSAMLKEYYEKYAARRTGPLFSGEDIMKTLGMGEGREVGEVIRALERAVIEGEVRTMDEARAYIKKRFHKGLG